MPAPPAPKKLGAIRLCPELFKACEASLREVGSLQSLSNAPPTRSHRGVPFDAILFELDAPIEDSLRAFSRSRREHALVPFVVLGRDVDADLVAEILRCGAEDFMLLPADPRALRHKVKRLFGEASGPAFDRPELAAFHLAPAHENQRRCFRVPVAPDFPVLSQLPGPIERPFEVTDLSIATETGPGGMQLTAERSVARLLPFDQWERRRDMGIVVRLPKGSPIAAAARLVPGLRNGPHGSVRFAIEYWVSRAADKQRFQRYWAEAQRRMRLRGR